MKWLKVKHRRSIMNETLCLYRTNKHLLMKVCFGNLDHTLLTLVFRKNSTSTVVQKIAFKLGLLIDPSNWNVINECNSRTKFHESLTRIGAQCCEYTGRSNAFFFIRVQAPLLRTLKLQLPNKL